MIHEVNFKDIDSYVSDLKSDYKDLSNFEALSIAVRMQRNDILAAAFAVSQSDRAPSALEKIAMQLGTEPEF